MIFAEKKIAIHFEGEDGGLFEMLFSQSAHMGHFLYVHPYLERKLVV